MSMESTGFRSTMSYQGKALENMTNTMRREFVNTHLVNENGSIDNLRSSRIQNLPNYKKTNLGENTSFIVVFQTIEIERLSSQIELLRVNLKDAERRLFNAQNFEVQIRQLTEKCFNYENQKESYRDEIEKLGAICDKLYHENERLTRQLSDMDFSLKQKYEAEKHRNIELTQEIQKWKSRYQAAERSKASQLEDLRNLMDSQRKSMIDRSIHEITVKFQNQRNGLENQIRKVRELLNMKKNEVEDYRLKCQTYEVTVSEMRNYQHIISENQNRTMLLTQQMHRLNEILRDREEQIEKYRKSEYSLHLQVKQQKEWQLQTHQVKALLENKCKELEEWRLRASRLQDEAIRGKEVAHYNNELESKLELAAKEISRLNLVLKAKLEDVDRVKQRLVEKDQQISEYRNIQNQISQFESKMNMLRAENDRLTGILKSRLEELETYKRRNNDLEDTVGRQALLEKDKKILDDKHSYQIRINEELKFAITKLQQELHTSKIYENKFKETDLKFSSLNRQIERLNQLLQSNGHQISNYQAKVSKMEKQIHEYRNIDRQLTDYEDKVVLLTQEIERLNTLIRNKNHDIDQLEKEKLQNHQKIGYYKNYESRAKQNDNLVAKLNNMLQAGKIDVENWQNKYRSADARTRELQNSIFVASQEKEKLNGALRHRTNDFEDLRNRLIQMENEKKQVGDLRVVCQEQHNQIVTYLGDIENMGRRSNEYEEAYLKEKKLADELAAKVIIMSAEVERVKRESSGSKAKSKELMEMQEYMSTVMSKMKSKDQQIEILLSKISHFQNQISMLSSELHKLLRQCQKSEADTQQLLQKVEEYQEYARRIHILGGQIDRLTQLNKELEKDNKSMRLKYAEGIRDQQRVEDFAVKTVLMAIEIESQRNRLEERMVNMEEMRKSILDPVRRI